MEALFIVILFMGGSIYYLISELLKQKKEIIFLKRDLGWAISDYEDSQRRADGHANRYYEMRNGNKWFNMLSASRNENELLEQKIAALYKVIPKEVKDMGIAIMLINRM